MPDPNPQCAQWLQQKQALSTQLEQKDEDMTAQWGVCAANDTIATGTKPTEGDVASVNSRISYLQTIENDPNSPDRQAATDAIAAYEAWLALKAERDGLQGELNGVVANLTNPDNHCPLE